MKKTVGFITLLCVLGAPVFAEVSVVPDNIETETDVKEEQAYKRRLELEEQERRAQQDKENCTGQYDTDKCREAVSKIADAQAKAEQAEQFLGEAQRYKQASAVSRRRCRTDLFRVYVRDASHLSQSAARLRTESAAELSEARKMHDSSTKSDVQSETASNADKQSREKNAAASEQSVREAEQKELESSNMISIGRY